MQYVYFIDLWGAFFSSVTGTFFGTKFYWYCTVFRRHWICLKSVIFQEIFHTRFHGAEEYNGAGYFCDINQAIGCEMQIWRIIQWHHLSMVFSKLLSQNHHANMPLFQNTIQPFDIIVPVPTGEESNSKSKERCDKKISRRIENQDGKHTQGSCKIPWLFLMLKQPLGKYLVTNVAFP